MLLNGLLNVIFFSCFDKVSYQIVLFIFNEYFNDYWISNLLNWFLRKGYIHLGELCDSQLQLKTETLQGFIIRSLIYNILLRRLDCFIAKSISKYSNFVAKAKKISEEYSNKTTRHTRLSGNLFGNRFVN